MKTYCIVLDEPAENWKPLLDKWPETFPLTERIAFAVLKDTESAEEIGDILGFNEKGQTLGLILRVTPGQYAGYHKKGLWEWLKKSPE